MKIDRRISKKLTFFSFFGSVGMTIYHSFGVIGGIEKVVCNSEIEEFIVYGGNSICGNLGGITMHYFFFTSAFLLYHNIDTSNWKRKIYNRVSSLGIPYIAWNLPFIVIQLIKNGDFFNLKLAINRIVLHPFIRPSWYLLGILLLLVALPVCTYIKLRSCRWIHTVLCIFIILTNRYVLDLDLHVLSSDFSDWLPNLVSYLPIYFIGMYCGLYYAEYYATLEKNKLILVVMLGTSLVPLVSGSGNNAVCFLFIIACWYLADYFIDQIDTDRFIYKCAFLIYMGHDVVLRVLSIVFSDLQEIRGFFLLPILLFFTLIAIGSMYIFAIVLNKYCPRLLRVITGSRFYR